MLAVIRLGGGEAWMVKSGNYQNLENRSKKRDSSGIVYIKIKLLEASGF